MCELGGRAGSRDEGSDVMQVQFHEAFEELGPRLSSSGAETFLPLGLHILSTAQRMPLGLELV